MKLGISVIFKLVLLRQWRQTWKSSTLNLSLTGGMLALPRFSAG